MNLFLVGLLTFCFAYVLVPPVIGLAWRIGAVDVPCDWRRMHRISVPRAGGLAIYTAFALGCVVLGHLSPLLMCALGGGALMLAVGLADDLFCLRPWSKLVFQISATTATVLGSGVMEGWRALLAIVWVLTLTNAHNFIDGLDGLFAGCAAIEGIALCLTFVLLGAGDAAAAPLLLALSCIAFWFFNRHPAQIFAGDCGSGTVGFLLGMLSLPLLGDFTAVSGTLSPLLIFAYPLTDLVTAVLRRLLRGKSPFAADRGHLHHRICAVGLNQVQCASVLLSLTATVGAVGILASVESLYLPAGIVSLAAVILLVALRRFISNFA